MKEGIYRDRHRHERSITRAASALRRVSANQLQLGSAGDRGSLVGEAAVDLRAGRDRDAVIADVAGYPRTRLYYQLARVDGALDLTCKQRRARRDLSLDAAVGALNERRAGKVAFDSSVYMQVRGSMDVAGDDDIRANYGKGSASVTRVCRPRRPR